MHQPLPRCGLAEAYLRAHPRCERCRREATIVRPRNGALRLDDWEQLEGLCNGCISETVENDEGHRYIDALMRGNRSVCG